jgi:hypothetical protein
LFQRSLPIEAWQYSKAPCFIRQALLAQNLLLCVRAVVIEKLSQRKTMLTFSKIKIV